MWSRETLEQEEEEGNTDNKKAGVGTGEAKEKECGTTEVITVATLAQSKGITVIDGRAMIGATKGTCATTTVNREINTSWAGKEGGVGGAGATIVVA